jgi:hypothetical protein
MRRFLTILICLSALALAQNVIAAAPASGISASRGTTAFEEAGAAVVTTPERTADDDVLAARTMVESDVPAPGAMMLFIVGLSGLTTVGSRTDPRAAQVTARQSA